MPPFPEKQVRRLAPRLAVLGLVPVLAGGQEGTTAGDSLRAAADSIPSYTDTLPTPPSGAGAPVQEDTTSRTFRLRAGRGRLFYENGERVSDLWDDVRLESEGTTVESRRARAYRERELAYFYEDVVVRDRGVTMTGDEGEFSRPEDYAALRGSVVIRDARGTIHADRTLYRRRTQLLWLWGRVDFQDEKTRVQADSVIYREAEGKGEAFGNVVLTDVETGSVASGPRATYDRTTGAAHLVARAHLMLREKDAEDTEVEADVVQMDRDKKIVRARGDVRIRRGPTTAGADSTRLDRDRQVFELRGRPWLRREGTRVSGRTIDVAYAGDAVKQVEVRHDARLLQSRSDTLLVSGPNEVRGDSATLYFEAGELQRAIVLGRATSRYVPEERQGDRISLNEAQADSMLVLFAKDDVEEVVFVGNASGVYRFFEGDLEALRQPPAARYDTTFGVVRGDTTRFDFAKRAEVVDYSAERILYLAPQNDLLLQDAAEVNYQDRTLRAGRIHYDADTDVLDATERPALDDAGSRVYGERMGYELETRHAWIQTGSTQYDQGYYTGRVLRKNEEGTLQVRSASYTTCDLARPHYRFESDRMKIYMHDKVVGRPVRLYLGEVPVGYLPFLVNSVNTERHSGFLQPDIEFGISSSSRYIRGLDYYWAASPYFDFLFSSDFVDRSRPSRASVGSVLRDTVLTQNRSGRLSVDLRYKVRYVLDGDLNYSIRRTFGGAPSTYWTLNGSHQQTLGERTNLRGSVDYASSDRALRSVYSTVNYNRSLERKLSSGATFNHRGDLASLNLSVRRSQLLDPGDTFTGTLLSHTLPQGSITFRSIRLAPVSSNPLRDGPVRRFLRSLQLSPGVNFGRETARVRLLQESVPAAGDSIPPPSTYRIREDEVISASTGASLGRQTTLWIFNVSPSVSYFERYRKDSKDPAAKRHFRNVGTGMGASTTFYGIFYPRRWGLTAIRHRLEPRASLSYTPEIAGQQHRSTSVNLSLGNTVDVKVQRRKRVQAAAADVDTTGVPGTGEGIGLASGQVETRLDGLLDWSLATSYNPTAMGARGQPDRKFGNISSTITVNRSGPLRLTISQTYDPYRGRILETRIPFALRLAGKFGYGDVGLQAEARNRVVEEEGEGAVPADTLVAPPPGTPPRTDPLADVDAVKVGKRDGSLSWDLGLSYYFARSEDRFQERRVGVALGIQPTRNWHVSYRASYDARRRELANPQIHVTRDLHCWKATFSRVYLGGTDEWGYYFRIHVAKHERDLFVESGDRSLEY
jgi:lipopolysaccharide export system protein LptA